MGESLKTHFNFTFVTTLLVNREFLMVPDSFGLCLAVQMFYTFCFPSASKTIENFSADHTLNEPYTRHSLYVIRVISFSECLNILHELVESKIAHSL